MRHEDTRLSDDEYTVFRAEHSVLARMPHLACLFFHQPTLGANGMEKIPAEISQPKNAAMGKDGQYMTMQRERRGDSFAILTAR
jgi:hypothetical protein